jgi:hypothetical protein
MAILIVNSNTKAKKMELFNKEIHDNLLDMGYTYEGKCGNGDDEYAHDVNDDWFAINPKGHINPLDLCEFTQGSVRGRKVMSERGPCGFMNIHEKD